MALIMLGTRPCRFSLTEEKRTAINHSFAKMNSAASVDLFANIQKLTWLFCSLNRLLRKIKSG